MEEKNIIKVLIVDDSKLTVVGLKTTFKNVEFIKIIGQAEDGKQAVSMTKELLPDVILMDIGMPIMDGIQATKEINKFGLDTKIVMLTSHADDAEVLDSLSAGATSYCMKDIEPDILIAVVKSTYDGASWLDPRIAKVVLTNLTKQPAKPEKNSDLTEREVEILSLIAKGFSNSEISDSLFISLNTVKTHIKNIFQKLEVEDRTQAALIGYKREIIKEGKNY